MIERSFLIVPADDEAALVAACKVPADALILDAADMVPPEKRSQARRLIEEFLQEGCAQAVWVRLPFGARLHEIALHRPAGFVLPAVSEHDALYGQDALVGLAEDEAGLTPDTIKFMPVVTEGAEAVLNLDTYRMPPLPRLSALAWDAESLSSEIGARSAREAGEFTFVYQVVRTLALMAAKSAGLSAVEASFSDLADFAGLERAARRAYHDGFTGMMALHPDQVEVINAAFTPSQDEIVRAERLVTAFASGEISVWLDGRTYGEAHVRQAERILALAAAIKEGED